MTEQTPKPPAGHEGHDFHDFGFDARGVHHAVCFTCHINFYTAVRPVEFITMTIKQEGDP